MGNGLMRVMSAVLALFILVSVTSQVYTSVTEKYKTETAEIYSSADKVSFRGVYIRSESTIRQTYNGVLSYPVSDGSKVAKDSVVAYVYVGENDIELNRQIEELTDEIALLKAAQNPGTVLTAQPDFISGLISERYQAVATRIAKRDVSDIKAQRDNLLTLMSIYQISVKQEDGYDDRIQMINSRIDELAKKRRRSKSEITSPDAGYFVSYTDGYESRLTMENTGELTADDIKEVIANADSMRKNRAKSEIGKLVKGYDWKIAGIIDNSESIYNPGDTVTLRFASTPDTVTAVIESLEPTDDPHEWTLILRCEEMTFNLVRKRVERVQMTLNDFEGIKVPREALRFNKNNEKGCYVLWGQRVLFKKVETIFENDEYLLSKLTSDEDYVCVYDDIIIKGVDTAAFMANSEENPEDEYMNRDEPEFTFPFFDKKLFPDSSTEESGTEENETTEESGDEGEYVTEGTQPPDTEDGEGIVPDSDAEEEPQFE